MVLKFTSKGEIDMAAKQTAGRDSLGDFAPKFAQLNDDILFGEVWSRENKLPLKTRSIITVTALISKGIVDSSLKFHLQSARKKWRFQKRDGGNLNASGFLCGLVQRVGGVPICKGGIRGGLC